MRRSRLPLSSRRAPLTDSPAVDPRSGSAAGVVGWDIGGVNTKVVRVVGTAVRASRVRPYEIQRDPTALAPLLVSLAGEVGAAPGDAHAVTMTAELSQVFRTKREGVAFVLDAAEAALAPATILVYTVRGDFVTPAAARSDPLSVAASNWAATARLVASQCPDALLVDIGTTTTDVIPIAGGAVASLGRTDPERLATGELAYTGVVRTPVEAIVTEVPLTGGMAGVSAEAFALSGDVYVWRGDLDPTDYTAPTPDGRPTTRKFCAERLARVVCADREMLDDGAISRIADAVAGAQLVRITAAIGRVRARHPSLGTAVVTGVGDFLAEAAARAAGLEVVRLASALGDAAARCAPAAAVALLLERVRSTHPPPAGPSPNADTPRWPGPAPREGRPSGSVDVVVKVGGGLLGHPHLAPALATVEAAAARTRIVIVPGGGPFADTVRAVDRTIGLGDDAAHWMAVLAMDQYAHVLASRFARSALASTPGEIEAAHVRNAVPVLTPSRWLRGADPLPHSWSVTSDSIAAWFARTLGASRLVLIKPPGATGEALVDDHFATALPAEVTSAVIPADRLDLLASVLAAIPSLAED